MDKLSGILFFDIETHAGCNFNELPSNLQNAWINHYHEDSGFDTPEESFKHLAGLYPEFGKVICISFAYFNTDGTVSMNSISGKDELKILTSFSKVLTALHSRDFCLCGCNIIGFDIPFLSVRYMINDMVVPAMLNTCGLKPWEISHIDIMNLWKLSRYRNTSLEAMCACLGIPCKSTEITGKNMHTVNINYMDWKMLETYCEEDVDCTIKVYEKLVKYLNL